MELATALIGEAQGRKLLEASSEATIRLHGQVMKLRSAPGDNTLQRLGSEFSGDNYGLGRLSSDRACAASVVVDCGANIGSFAIAAWLTNRDTRVVALEPMPVTYIFLRWNLLLNHVPTLGVSAGSPLPSLSSPLPTQAGVLPLLAPATADGRPVSLEYSPTVSQNGITDASFQHGTLPKNSDYDVQSPGDSNYIRQANTFRRTRRVASVDLAAWLQERRVPYRTPLCFLKLDCEGCEHEVVPRLNRTSVLKKARHVAAEVHECLSTHACQYSRLHVSATKALLEQTRRARTLG